MRGVSLHLHHLFQPATGCWKVPTTTSPHAGQQGRADPLSVPIQTLHWHSCPHMGGQVASPWDGHSSWNTRGGFILVSSTEQGKQAGLGKGTEGFGAASSSWSSEWLMICVQGRTNPPLQRGANTACCARRRLCCSYLRQQPLSVVVRAGLCVRGVSIHCTKHSRTSSLCCRAAATSALPSVREGELGRSSLLGEGCRNQLREGLHRPKVHKISLKAMQGCWAA